MDTLPKASQKQIGQFVAEDFRTASIFSQYGIDFCCRGHRTVEEVCLKNNIDVEGNTYRVTYAMLEEFEKDLHLHIHLENNILFPEVIKLKQKFKTP